MEEEEEEEEEKKKKEVSMVVGGVRLSHSLSHLARLGSVITRVHTQTDESK